MTAIASTLAPLAADLQEVAFADLTESQGAELGHHARRLANETLLGIIPFLGSMGAREHAGIIDRSVAYAYGEAYLGHVQQNTDSVSCDDNNWLASSCLASGYVDLLVAVHTAFKSMQDMLQAHAGYRPSLDMREPVMVRIADVYDALQAERGDARRAYRYGTN